MYRRGRQGDRTGSKGGDAQRNNSFLDHKEPPLGSNCQKRKSGSGLTEFSLGTDLPGLLEASLDPLDPTPATP
jgi:hypothetical protein